MLQLRVLLQRRQQFSSVDTRKMPAAEFQGGHPKLLLPIQYPNKSEIRSQSTLLFLMIQNFHVFMWWSQGFRFQTVTASQTVGQQSCATLWKSTSTACSRTFQPSAFTTDIWTRGVSPMSHQLNCTAGWWGFLLCRESPYVNDRSQVHSIMHFSWGSSPKVLSMLRSVIMECFNCRPSFTPAWGKFRCSSHASVSATTICYSLKAKNIKWKHFQGHCKN